MIKGRQSNNFTQEKDLKLGFIQRDLGLMEARDDNMFRTALGIKLFQIQQKYFW